MLWQLSSDEHLLKFELLRAKFDPLKHDYHVDICVTYPKAVYFNKQGLISAKTQDLSNIEKPIIDLIFLPKYYTESSPNGCLNLNCDDRFVTKMSSAKVAGDSDSIRITISIVSRN